MSTNTQSKKGQLTLANARRIAGWLIRELEPSCERIEVAGSIRRKTDTVGDVEIVVIPRVRMLGQQLGLFGESALVTVNDLDRQLEQMIERKVIQREIPFGWKSVAAWGHRQKRFWLVANATTWTQVDRVYRK